MSDTHTLERPKGLLTGSATGGQLAGSSDIEAARPGPPEVFGGGNAAEAARLVLPAGEKSDGVRILQIEVSPPARESQHYRATIVLEERAEAKVLVRFVEKAADTAAASGVENTAEPVASVGAKGAGGQGIPPAQSRLTLLTTALDIRLAAHSRLKLYIVSGLPPYYFREAFDRAVLQEGASLEWTTVGFDAANGIYSANIELEGAGSELDLAGAYGAHCDTEQEHIVSIHHSAPRTKSRTTLKSALKDSAHLIFRGLIHVETTAHGTDAYLSDRNLILEDGARAESLPQLKIETDDVACSHGATTGGPRQEELFYLMSRGLDRDAAKNMLVLGHLGSVFNRLPTELAEEMERAAATSLGIGDGRSCP
jgi:Fe-S cluster assembly protein SufD